MDSNMQCGSSAMKLYLEVDLNIGNGSSAYSKSAMDVVKFNRVYDEHDISNENSTTKFKPLMAHQIFGENEKIFGYRQLSITLNYLHNSCKCFVDVECSGRINNPDTTPDDYMNALNPWLPKHYVTDKNNFLELLAEEKHDKIYGVSLHEFSDQTEMLRFPQQKVITNYKVTLCELDDNEFKEFHENFETYIIWFIDGASLIDLDDDRWVMFYLYEEFVHPDNKQIYRSPIGFCSVYKFYSFPSKSRPRISQFFILPTYQRRGLGSELYKAVIRYFSNLPNINDITVEEPTDQFQEMRDKCDVIWLFDELKNKNIRATFENKQQIFQMLNSSKFCKKQLQRLSDIINCFLEYRATRNNYKKTMEAIRSRIVGRLIRQYKLGKKTCQTVGLVFEKNDSEIKEEANTEFGDYIKKIKPVVDHLISLHL